MLDHKKSFHLKIALVISAIAISLGACSGGTESNSSPSDSASSSPTPAVSASSSPSPLASSSSSQTTASPTPANVTIPGVKNLKEITFKATTNSQSGFFDAINGSSAAKVEVAKATPITASGWAVLVTTDKPANRVIVTYGDNNSIVAAAPVNLSRPDVAKSLQNPAYSKSGWSVTFNSSTLPPGPVVLKAWAYNSATKQATQLASTREVVTPQ